MTISIEKTLRIDQAEKGESQGIETIDSSKRFTQELNLYGIKDVFNTARIGIKQDNQKYIFIIDNTPRFAIDKIVMQQRLEDFYQQQTQEELAIRLLDTELQYITGTSKQELDDLQSDIETDMNIENIKYRVERCIKFFEQELMLAKESTALFEGHKYNRADKGLWNLQKVEIRRRLEQLKKIQDQIQRLEKNKGKKYTITKDNEIKEVKMDDINAYNTDLTILQFNERIEEIIKEAPEFIKTRNEIILENGDTTPGYEIILNNVHDAAMIKMIFENINNDDILLNRMALSTDKRQVLQQDLDRLQKYLEDYANHPNEITEPFIPKSGDDFARLLAINPELQKYVKINKRAGKKNDKGTTYNEEVSANATKEQEGGAYSKADKKPNTYISSEYDNAKEAFAKGGINGEIKYRIDKTNMKPEQKQFRSGVGNLAMTGGMIFLGWKMLSSAWNLITGKHKGKTEEKRKDRAWLIAPTALIFGSQAWTGEGPMGLFKGGKASEKIAGLFGWSSGEENRETARNTNGETQQMQETRIRYESFPGATALFNGMTYGEMAQFLIQDGDQIKIDPNRYDELLITLEKDKKNPTGAEFVKSIGKNDDKRILDLALTGMGITSVEQLTNTPDKAFNETASEAIIRLREVGAYMEEKGYNKLNAETQPLVDSYISTGKPTLEELDNRKDVFYKFTEIQDQTGLEARITELAGNDSQKKQDLLLAINTFRGNMPNGERRIDLQGNRPNIRFVTYGQSVEINLESKTLTGFTPTRFDSYFELFKAANLTNTIQDICKDKVSQKPEPFYVGAGGDITFDNAKLLSKDFDTRIISGGRGGSLKDISPKLETYKEKYATYLNGLRNRKVVQPPVTPEIPRWRGLDSKIDALTTDPGTRQALYTGISLFYNYMPNGQKKIDIIGTQRPTVKFETYNKTTEIDLSTRTMKGFGQAFPDYFELFKAANLTNRIKYICRNKNITGNAFYISGGGDITLDNAKIFSTDFDTEIMTGGRGGSLSKVSPVLEKFKNDYVEYLNHLAPRKEKEPVVFDTETKILTIGKEGKFSIVSAKEIAGTHTTDLNDIQIGQLGANFFDNLDTKTQLAIQRMTSVQLGTEGTVMTKINDKIIQLTIRRIE